jgi:hypothetical protein
MCDENIEIGVTEITNNILVSAQPTDQIIDINVLEEVENVELTITPSVVEVNIDVTQELITEIVTVDANTCVNIVDVTVTDATDNVTLNITPSLVEVNINRGENNLSIEEYESFADLPTIGDTDTYYITLDDNKFWRWDSIDEIYVEISDSNDKIPYLGAYKNSDLGEWGIKSNWFGLDLTPTNPPTVAGTITWNDTDGTADLILKGGNVTLQIGQEEVVRVVNKTGATLNEADFKAVRIRSVAEGGAQGQRLAVVLAQGNNDANSATTIGLVTESISDNQEGFITTSGEVKKINTTGAKSYLGAETWVDGDILYLSPTHAGYLTNVKPQAPNHTIIIGWVVYAHANNGKIFVKVDNGYELDELHNVKITTPTNNQGLVYDSALSVWKNASIQLPLSATSPLSIASNVLSITKADATTDGYLSSTDWNYFSAKQQPLFGTGFVKATGSVISYDNTVYTPQSRTLTINGTAYDLSADRSWSISVGSGMRNVSSFVATAGQTTFTIVGGYTAGLVDVFVNGARLNSGDYTATNSTTVVLGTGVVANDIVDIINYTASLTSGITGSGTAGYLPLWSGSSNLTNSIVRQDSNGVYVDFATGTKVFKVTNGVIASQDGGLYAGSGYQLVFADYGSSEFAAIEGSSFSGASSYIRFLTNASEKMRLTSSGNLGLGYSSPRAKLDVNGYVYSGGFWTTNDSLGGAFYIGDLATGASYTYISGKGTSSTDTYLSLSTNNTERVRIIANGNVGIGLINPAYKLDVSGDINITGSFRINGVAIGGGSGTVTGTGTTNYIAKWSGSSAIGNSQIFDNGTNVGINTASPSAILHIKGGNNNSLWIDNAGTQYTSTYIANNGIVKAFFVWDNTNSSSLQLIVNNSEKMRILENGRVGINTSSPSYALHVKGTSGTGARLIQIDGTGTAYNIMSIVNDGCQLFVSTEGNTGGNIATGSLAYAGIIDTNTNTSLQFATWATVRMTILNSGNVGIGTTSPAEKLHILGTGVSGGSLRIQTSGSINAYLALQDNTRDYYVGSNSGSFYIYDGNAASERFRINSNGTTLFHRDMFTYINGGIFFQGDGTYGTGVYSRNSGFDLILQAGSSERLRILSGGQVLIGTSTSYNNDSMLSVQNSIITKAYGGSGSVTTGITIPSGSVGIFFARGYDTLSGVAFSVVYNVSIKVGGGGGSDVYYALISQTGTTKTFTFDNNGGYLRINPSANTQWSGTFLGAV